MLLKTLISAIILAAARLPHNVVQQAFTYYESANNCILLRSNLTILSKSMVGNKYLRSELIVRMEFDDR